MPGSSYAPRNAVFGAEESSQREAGDIARRIVEEDVDGAMAVESTPV